MKRMTALFSAALLYHLHPIPAGAGLNRLERLGPPISLELLNRCAAMHLALLPEVQGAYERGEEGAAAELAWMIETGRQLLAAGGEG